MSTESPKYMAIGIVLVLDSNFVVIVNTSKAYRHKKAPFGAFIFYAWSTNFFSSSALLIMSVVDGKSGMVGNGRVSRFASVSLE